MTTIPIGPIHPALKEPMRIKLILEGEKPVDVEIEMGYVHRGIEKIVEGKHCHKAIHIVERVCGICSNVHTHTFAQCVEKISKIKVPEKARYLRLVVYELERIHSHLLAISTYCLAIEHETLGLWLLNVREPIMDLFEMITGNRINMAFNVIGGVRKDITREMADEIIVRLDSIKEDIENIMNAFEKSPLVGLRSKGIGVLGYKEIMKTRAVGPIARASGLPESDWRLRKKIYKELGFKPCWRKEGDNFARNMVRFEEILESIKLIKKALEYYRECSGDFRVRAEIKAGEGEIRNEAHRGEVLYQMAITNGGIIKKINIRTPSVMNFESFKYMIKTCPTVADAVSAYVTTDPCVACAERAITIVRR
ncbi:hydrogenase large subunit [Methanocaldococcus sp.]